MIKILIVEDESASREGLKNLLSAHSAAFSIKTASNGYEGYEKALYFQPDIIITDIKMPKWDGLTMIEKLRKKNLQSEILVLTGFAEFEYAQKAIQYHVSDYILKPILPDQIIKKTDHLVIELNKKSSVLQNASPSKLYLMSEDDLSLFRSQIETHNYTDFFYGIIYMGKDTHLPREVKDFMNQESDLYVVILADRHYRGFVFGFYNHNIRHSMISRMSMLLKKHPNLTCIYHLKKNNQPIHWLSDFNKLTKSIIWSVSYCSSFFAYNSEMREDEYHLPDLSFYKKELQRLYYAGNYKACRMFIQERISQMQAQQKHPKEIIYAATSGIQKFFSEELYISTRNQLNEAKTPSEINALLDTYFSSQPVEQTDSQYSRLIQSAIQYIQQHYQEQISLTTAAESLSITSQYLSKLFMQETSRTFIDCLTNVRIDKSKVYLTETNLQINVIGARVGYTDPKYFCTVFKKIVGLTPNQYRKANNNK